MYNSNKPSIDELPSSAQLLRSTIIAAVAAVVILVTIVLPADYGIDPTKIGRVLGLAEMGEIKTQLAAEAEADKQSLPFNPPAEADKQSSIGRAILGLFISQAHAQTVQSEWTDEVSISLKPGEGAEIKLVMEKGAVATFAWEVTDGVVNYDLHGDGGGQSISYKRARSVPSHKGEVVAAFTGNHGWFWRNRGRETVTVTLRVKGAYSSVKRTA